jgi:hypothetical protein
MGGGWPLRDVQPQLLVSAVSSGGRRCGGPWQTRKVPTLPPKALKAQTRSAPSTFADQAWSRSRPAVPMES